MTNLMQIEDELYSEKETVLKLLKQAINNGSRKVGVVNNSEMLKGKEIKVVEYIDVVAMLDRKLGE